MPSLLLRLALIICAAASPTWAAFDLATPKPPVAAKKPKDVTVHEDKLGVARVVFVMNPTDARVEATFPVAKVLGLRDLLASQVTEVIVPESGAFTVEMPARTVKVFAAE